MTAAAPAMLRAWMPCLIAALLAGRAAAQPATATATATTAADADADATDTAAAAPETDGSRAPLPPRFDERARREIAELGFQRRAIRFRAIAAGDRAGVRGASWGSFLVRGELDQALDPEEFYRAVGRDDLAAAYRRRRAVRFTSHALAAAFLLGALVRAETLEPSCAQRVLDGNQVVCTQINDRSFTWVWILAGLGVTEAAIGAYFALRPQPIDERDARALADAYNQRLRRMLGLPASPRRALLHEVRIAPYAAPSGGGLALGARF